MKNTIRRSFAIMIAALMLMACGLARAESYEASTMRLMNFEGEVRIEDASGQPRFVMKNGDTFTGEFRDNRFDKGRYTLKEDASYFEGTFKDGQPDQGNWYDKNGNKL